VQKANQMLSRTNWFALPLVSNDGEQEL